MTICIFLHILGTRKVIQQTTGKCGGNIVNTEFFKFSDYDKDGNLINEENSTEVDSWTFKRREGCEV